MSELDMDVGLNIHKVVELVCLLLERDIICLKLGLDHVHEPVKFLKRAIASGESRTHFLRRSASSKTNLHAREKHR